MVSPLTSIVLAPLIKVVWSCSPSTVHEILKRYVCLSQFFTGIMMNLDFLAVTLSCKTASGSGSLAIPVSLYNKAVPLGRGKNKLPLCEFT